MSSIERTFKKAAKRGDPFVLVLAGSTVVRNAGKKAGKVAPVATAFGYEFDDTQTAGPLAVVTLRYRRIDQPQ
jgi:hypothetical protein